MWLELRFFYYQSKATAVATVASKSPGSLKCLDSKPKSWRKAGYSFLPLQELCQREMLDQTSVVIENGVHVSKHSVSHTNKPIL